MKNKLHKQNGERKKQKEKTVAVIAQPNALGLRQRARRTHCGGRRKKSLKIRLVSDCMTNTIDPFPQFFCLAFGIAKIRKTGRPQIVIPRPIVQNQCSTFRYMQRNTKIYSTTYFGFLQHASSILIETFFVDFLHRRPKSPRPYLTASIQQSAVGFLVVFPAFLI